MIIYKGIRFDDHSHSEGDEYNYNWSQICTACAFEHGIFVEAAKHDCPGELVCGIEGCYNEADFYLDFDGSEPETEEEQQGDCACEIGAERNKYEAAEANTKNSIE